MELLKETVERSYEVESDKGGLVIRKALYGKLSTEQPNEEDVANVTRAMQAMVINSRLDLPTQTALVRLLSSLYINGIFVVFLGFKWGFLLFLFLF